MLALWLPVRLLCNRSRRDFNLFTPHRRATTHSDDSSLLIDSEAAAAGGNTNSCQSIGVDLSQPLLESRVNLDSRDESEEENRNMFFQPVATPGRLGLFIR